jgi:hypothetical protein
VLLQVRTWGGNDAFLARCWLSQSAWRTRHADHVALGVGEVPDGEFPRRWLGSIRRVPPRLSAVPSAASTLGTPT